MEYLEVLAVSLHEIEFDDQWENQFPGQPVMLVHPKDVVVVQDFE